jgi:hypothetical protein
MAGRQLVDDIVPRSLTHMLYAHMNCSDPCAVRLSARTSCHRGQWLLYWEKHLSSVAAAVGMSEHFNRCCCKPNIAGLQAGVGNLHSTKASCQPVTCSLSRFTTRVHPRLNAQGQRAIGITRSCTTVYYSIVWQECFGVGFALCKQRRNAHPCQGRFSLSDNTQPSNSKVWLPPLNSLPRAPLHLCE